MPGGVYVGLLDAGAASLSWDPLGPELMFRRIDTLIQSRELLAGASVVCGCGGGSAVGAWLPALLSTCPTLVLDADALNAIARDEALQTLTRQRAGRGWVTVLTPHPLEAARLLQQNTASVMADRLASAQALSERFGAICVLKGSGSVISAPLQRPGINASGNARLATAGTGDVLAGFVGAALAPVGHDRASAFQAVARAVFHHGRLADHWDASRQGTLTASRLAARAGPLS